MLSNSQTYSLLPAARVLSDFLKVYEKSIINVVMDYLNRRQGADHLMFKRLTAANPEEKKMLEEWLRNYLLSKIIDHKRITGFDYEFLATIFVLGIGVRKDFSKSVELFEKAISEGNQLAKINLAYLYQEGLGVDQDLATAFNLFNYAYDVLDYRAVGNNLGYLYANGIFVQADAQKAFQYYLTAAYNGSESAMNALGDLFMTGLLSYPKDQMRALHYYQSAACSGSTDALVNLAVIYEEGILVEKDIEQSICYLEQAAKRNNAAALYHLGIIYEKYPEMTYLLPAADRNHIAYSYYKAASTRGYEQAFEKYRESYFQKRIVTDRFLATQINHYPQVIQSQYLTELIDKVIEGNELTSKIQKFDAVAQEVQPIASNQTAFFSNAQLANNQGSHTSQENFKSYNHELTRGNRG